MRALLRRALSAAVLAEARDVLTRPILQRKFPILTPEWVANFLTNIVAKAAWLPSVPRNFEYPRDPKDEPYVNLALAADVRFLVSRDRDLLDRMKDAEFTKRYPTLTILTPEAFLRALRLAQHLTGEDSGKSAS
jgi:putative PIN family toxin of toxin-antitoxin system